MSTTPAEIEKLQAQLEQARQDLEDAEHARDAEKLARMKVAGQLNTLHKTLAAVRGCRTVDKSHMVHNAYTPTMAIDAQTYEVRADGELLSCEPATVLPMAQRYFLF